MKRLFARVVLRRDAREGAHDDDRGSMDTEATQGADEQTADDSARAEELQALADKLAEANARADENHAKVLYVLADFENYKKRAERLLLERAAAGKRATLAKFLPVLDNLQRALGYQPDSDGLRGGLAATQREFESLLASEDVKPMAVLGAPFDPRRAEAIGTRESDDVDEDTVVDEVLRGYTAGDEVLRPARVIVAKKSAG